MRAYEIQTARPAGHFFLSRTSAPVTEATRTPLTMNRIAHGSNGLGIS